MAYFKNSYISTPLSPPQKSVMAPVFFLNLEHSFIEKLLFQHELPSINTLCIFPPISTEQTEIDWRTIPLDKLIGSLDYLYSMLVFCDPSRD